MTTHLHLVLKLRMSGTITLTPYFPHGNERATLPLPLHLLSYSVLSFVITVDVCTYNEVLINSLRTLSIGTN